MLRDTYARIDLSALSYNLTELEKAAGTPLLAVVKADAYGHGACRIANEAWNNGIKWFAVSNPDEAVEIRDCLPEAKILVLSGVMEKAYDSVINYGISVAAFKPEHIYGLEEAAKKSGKKALIHLKADTGMGRIGFRTDDELTELIKALKVCENVIPEGFFTHFATADEADLSYTEMQLERYVHFREILFKNGIKPICHASNSAGIVTVPKAHFDLCRAGISMYGYPPSKETDMHGIVLKPVMSLISYISFIKEVDKGESVSYGRIFTADRRRKIATVPIGYADGYFRSLSNKAFAIINGRKVKQVGRVCMDQIMFDVTDVDADEGDEVELFGHNIGADELAEIAGTISYELLTGITKRVPRVYVR